MLVTLESGLLNVAFFPLFDDEFDIDLVFIQVVRVIVDLCPVLSLGIVEFLDVIRGLFELLHI